VTSGPCPQHIIYITVTTSKPVYNVGDTIVVLWDASQIPQGATATLSLQSPSGTYNFNLDYSALMGGSYAVGQAEQKDVGQWTASLAGSAQSGACPSPFQGSTTFQVGQVPPTTIATSSSTSTSCPIYLVPVNVWTSKPVYVVGDEIVIFWSTGGGTPIYANGVLTLSGPSGTYNFNLDQNAMGKGQYDVGRAEQKDVGSWTVTLTVLGPPNCPPAGRGSTTFQVSQITTDLIASSCGTIPDSPKAGDSVKFWVDFNIVGGAPPYVFNYQMFLDGNLMQTLPSSPVQFNAGGLQSITTDTTWTVTAGSHTERWVLNPDHMLQESDYSNNEVSCPFTVGGYQITLDSVATDVPAWVDGNLWPHIGSVTFAGTTYSQLPATATAQSGWYDVAATPPSGECTGAGGVQCFSFVFEHWEIGEGVTQVDQPTSLNARVQVEGSGHVTAYYKITTSNTGGYCLSFEAVASVDLQVNPTGQGPGCFLTGREVTMTVPDRVSGPNYIIYYFFAWSLDDEVVSLSPTLKVTMNANHAAKALYVTTDEVAPYSGNYINTMQETFGTPDAIKATASSIDKNVMNGGTEIAMPVSGALLMVADVLEGLEKAAEAGAGLSKYEKFFGPIIKNSARLKAFDSLIQKMKIEPNVTTLIGVATDAGALYMDASACNADPTGSSGACNKVPGDENQLLGDLYTSITGQAICAALSAVGSPLACVAVTIGVWFVQTYKIQDDQTIADAVGAGLKDFAVWLGERIEGAFCNIWKIVFGSDNCKVFSVRGGSSVVLLVQDANGRKVGATLQNGALSTCNEIPNALYSGPESHPQQITIPDPVQGGFTILVSAVSGGGSYEVTATMTGTQGTSVSRTSGSISGGQVQSIAGDITSSGTVVVHPSSFWADWRDLIVIPAVAVGLVALAVWQRRRGAGQRKRGIEKTAGGPRILGVEDASKPRILGVEEPSSRPKILGIEDEES
jgi:hypothetical protein